MKIDLKLKAKTRRWKMTHVFQSFLPKGSSNNCKTCARANAVAATHVRFEAGSEAHGRLKNLAAPAPAADQVNYYVQRHDTYLREIAKTTGGNCITCDENALLRIKLAETVNG